MICAKCLQEVKTSMYDESVGMCIECASLIKATVPGARVIDGAILEKLMADMKIQLETKNDVKGEYYETQEQRYPQIF